LSVMDEDISRRGAFGRSQRLWIGSLVIVAGLIGAEWFTSSSAPSSADWAASAETIAAQVAEGDALWILPTWSQLDPAFRAGPGSALDGLALLTMSEPTVLDLARHRRVWIVSLDPDVRGLPDAVGPMEPIASHGLLHVSTVDLPARELSFDLATSLESADVNRWDTEGESRRCFWRRDRHHCPGVARDQDVRWTWGEVGNTRRKAAFVHAGPDGGRLELAWDAVKTSAELHVSLGLGLQAVRREAGGDVRVRVSLGGAVLWEQLLTPRDFHWYTRRFALDSRESTRLSIEVFAADARKREVFVDVVSF